MGIFVLKMICAIAAMLKEGIGEDDVPDRKDLAFYDPKARPSGCTGRWIQAMVCYLQAKLRPKTHLELATLISISDEDRIARKAMMQKWVEDKVLKRRSKDCTSTKWRRTEEKT